MRFAKTTTSIFPFVCGFFPGNRCRFPTLLQGRGPRPFVVAFAMLALALASAPSFGAGACCLPIGSCVQTNQSNCNDLGGSFQGNGTSCDPDPCPTPTGACCFVDAPCQDMTLGDCFAAGVEGAYQGNGTSCAVEGCPPAGACCSSNGSGNCTMTVGSLPCSGIFQGSDTTCEPNPCPQPSGACCFADQSCLDNMADEDCAAADGYYIGSNTVCANITCPIGACCMPDGSCIPDVFPPACWDSGGTYKGHFSTCSPGFCEIGACCAVYDGGNSEDPFIEGECTRWSNPICAATGGAFQGHGTTCAPNPCPQPTGACCLPDDLCAGVQEQSDCTSAGGTYLGHGSDCSEPFCDASSAVWGSFDSTRSAHPLSSSASGQLRGLIAASGASLASPTSELTFEYLFGVDVFYTSSLREPGELTTEEQIALHDWVASGGTLIVTADYPQEYFPAIESFTDFYGVSSFVELPCVHRVGTPVATHPITEGVEHYRVACSATYSFGADALELGVNGLGDVFMIVIEEATGFPVDGRLLVTGDHNLFEDQYLVEFDNLRLATNMVAWANRHCPIGFAEAPSMVLFREAIDSAWDFGPSDIPGWDHVGFYTDFKVYESHPGYDTGGDDCLTNFVSSYWDPCVNEYRCIDFHSGIQKPHTLASFRHDTIETTTKAANDSVVVLDAALAAAMQEFIEFEMSNPDIQFLDLSCPFFDLACWVDRLQPLLQKGYIEINGGIYYTCVGLVERAAEEAGLNVDEGFIPDEIESFVVPLLADPVPMLSPFLMYNAMTGEFGFNDATDWLLGYLDPVDFLITDPLGRRLGYTAATGELNEIPNAIFSGDGDLEQIVILDPLPGEYVVELVGLGEQAEAAFGGTIEGQLFQGFLEVGQTVELTFVFPEHLCPADLDGDGEVRVPDLIILLGAWGPNPGHPADLDGNGEVRVPDLITLLGEWGACP